MAIIEVEDHVLYFAYNKKNYPASDSMSTGIIVLKSMLCVVLDFAENRLGFYVPQGVGTLICVFI